MLKPKTKIILIISAILLVLFIIIFILLNKRKDNKGVTTTLSPYTTLSPSPHTTLSPKTIKNDLMNNSKFIIPYLMALYPAVPRGSWFAFTSEDIRRLYQSLNWYYLPVVDDVGYQNITYILQNKALKDVISRRAPLAGPYKNQWTEAFLSDSTDQQIFREALDIYPPISCTNNQDCTSINGTCVNKVCQGGCIGAQDNPLNPNDPCSGYCYGNQKLPDGTIVQKDPKKCKLCCESGSICNKDGICQMNVTSAFCSVFPSTVDNSQGPTWKSGAKGCTSDMLENNKVSPECLYRLFGEDTSGKSLCGSTGSSPLCANKGAADYQFITLIQPFARKQGCPNYAYMEQVAYVCEGTGRQLLSAPKNIYNDPTDPDWIGIFMRNKFCGVECPVDGSADPSKWQSCMTAGNNWKTTNNIKPVNSYIKENFVQPEHDSRILTSNFSSVGAAANTGNLKGTANGPSGCTFKDGWNVFDQTGVNGNGIWIRKGYGVYGLIDGHAVLKNGSIPSTLSSPATYALSNCRQHTNYVSDLKLPANKCWDKTMFYWEAGYGKFMSMGKTGIYQNYIHCFLTVPNDPQTLSDNTTVRLRSCLPEILSMGVGSSALKSLEMLAGESRSRRAVFDKRPYLSGFVTTFQTDSQLGKKYGLVPSVKSELTGANVKYVYDFDATDDDWNNNVIVISGRMYWAKKWGDHADPLNHGKVFLAKDNDWYKEYNGSPPGVENAQGLMNPQEGIKQWMTNHDQNDYIKAPTGFVGDANLCAVASQCIQCYYPPNLQIVNPHYRKPVKMDLDDACVLWQGMYIYGDTGGDQYGYSAGPAKCRELSATGCEAFPYGSYYFSAAIGSCIYAVTAAMGWNSSQFALMGTGGGNSKFCTYPGYDYEIVQIGTRNVMVEGEDPYSFKLLDITGNSNQAVLDFYIKYGFIQGSTKNGDSNATSDMMARMQDDVKSYNMTGFDACKMPLNEANVDPTIWGNNKPNMMFYNKPDGKCDWTSSDYETCIKTDAPSGWVYSQKLQDGSENVITCRDCPYKDATGSIRDQATATSCLKKFVPKWM